MYGKILKRLWVIVYAIEHIFITVNVKMFKNILIIRSHWLPFTDDPNPRPLDQEPNH